MKKQTGKISLTWVLVILGVAIIAATFLFGQSSPSSATVRFLDALARGDAKTLTEVTYLEGQSEEEIREQWEYATHIGEYYRFLWEVNSETMHGDENATVAVSYIVNADRGSSYEEIYRIPMTQIDGEWKVDLSQMTREIYPALPR
jgi:flagellar basal body-associated protein FliL